jgi:ABC-type sulfate/molybdate transport systems ATPase subunit
LAEVLRELLNARRVPVLLVTHDHRDAQRMATRLISLRSGLIEDDSLVFREPSVRVVSR